MKNYSLAGNLEDGDCIIGHSFGTSVDAGSVNANLADYMITVADDRPMIADRTLVDAMPLHETHMSHIVEGHVTDIKMQGVGTWGTLQSAKQFMEANDLEMPIMVAQAYHIQRVVKQAAKLGMLSIVPEGLPTDFDTTSEQIWTRSAYLWVPFNALGQIVLKRRGQL